MKDDQLVPGMRSPEIVKADSVVGFTLAFRDASPDDAEYILSLRTDATKSQHLSSTSTDVASQERWLSNYAAGTGQAYFIIEAQSEPVGTVRLYDARAESFCWGSWILGQGAPRTAALESALMVYAYAVDHLGFRAAHFDVRKGNERVWQFHERFGARRVAEGDLDYFYSIDADAIQQSRLRYERYLPNGVSVRRRTG